MEDAKSYPWEIIDVNLGKTGNKDLDLLDSMHNIPEQYMLNLKRNSECGIEAETKDQNLNMLQ